MKINLLGQTLGELQELCIGEGFPRFTAKQLCDWLYKKRVDSIDAMTNLSLSQRARLNEIAYIGREMPMRCAVSKDGTKKYLFPVQRPEGGGLNYVEAVYIPESKTSDLRPPTSDLRPPTSDLRPSTSDLRPPTSDLSRATLCVSCQAGCKMGCRFCVTGMQGFHGNLSAGDILNQLFEVERYAPTTQAIKQSGTQAIKQSSNQAIKQSSNQAIKQSSNQAITNIVFMGMGEPMDNLDAVLSATQVLTADWGLGWSPKRITVSTVGILPGLRRFLDESQCHLAVSLHNPVPQERLEMMPVQKAFPLNDVLALLRQYDWSGQRRLSFEYTMFRGINDDLAHAQKLVDALRGLDCRVNLIRFHESPNAPFKQSGNQAIKEFQDYLNRHGIICTLRASRGQDIDAACGLLSAKEH